MAGKVLVISREFRPRRKKSYLKEERTLFLPFKGDERPVDESRTEEKVRQSLKKPTPLKKARRRVYAFAEHI
eukprot:4839626-Pyramimonas_sp.AAC.1